MDEAKRFRTLRDFTVGHEPDEENYLHCSASLRIFGASLNLKEITSTLGLEPTSSHRAGERKGPKSPPYRHDMWSYSPRVAETEPLEKHIDALWSDIKSHRDYLKQLKRHATVDVFLGYRSNCDHAGVEVPHTCLEMFTELEIPFGLSIIIA
ncbi:MAG: DUF4279 domain-containing protein [Pirellulales bacterium]|nr:DUF4279 domain-containing protein [Pirellulales bacterium]